MNKRAFLPLPVRARQFLASRCPLIILHRADREKAYNTHKNQKIDYLKSASLIPYPAMIAFNLAIAASPGAEKECSGKPAACCFALP